MRKNLLSLLGCVTLLAGLTAAPGTLASTTVINFDITPTGSSIPNNTLVTNQYQNIGVTISGVRAINQNLTLWIDPFGTTVGIAETGVMTFTLNPSIIGSVQSVSLYVSSIAPVTISAYDANGSLVGQTVSSSAASNQFLSVTSSGNPITTVRITGGDSDYVLDTISFDSSTRFSQYDAAVYFAPKLAAFAARERFTLGANSQPLNPPSQTLNLNIGALNITLPAGSFAKDAAPRTTAYVYRGKVNNVDLYVWISPTSSSQTYLLFALGAGYTFTNGLSTVSVSLTTDNNSANLSVAPHYVNLIPSAP